MPTSNASDKQLVEQYRSMTPEQRKQFRKSNWKQNAQNAQEVENELQTIDQSA